MFAFPGGANYAVSGAGLDEAASRAEQDVPGSDGLQRRKPERYGAVLRVCDGKVGFWMPRPKVLEQRRLVCFSGDRIERGSLEQSLGAAQGQQVAEGPLSEG